MKLLILLGSARQERKGENIAKWANDIAAKDERFQPEIVDVKELDLPFYDEPGGGPFGLAAAGTDYTNPKGRAWADKVATYDAVILVTPEYNHGYPASLKNALDWVGPEWSNKPVSFVGYGWSANGVRAVEQLRQVVAELGLIQTKAEVTLNIGSGLDESGKPSSDHAESALKNSLDQIAALAALSTKH